MPVRTNISRELESLRNQSVTPYGEGYGWLQFVEKDLKFLRELPALETKGKDFLQLNGPSSALLAAALATMRGELGERDRWLVFAWDLFYLGILLAEPRRVAGKFFRIAAYELPLFLALGILLGRYRQASWTCRWLTRFGGFRLVLPGWSMPSGAHYGDRRRPPYILGLLSCLLAESLGDPAEAARVGPAFPLGPYGAVLKSWENPSALGQALHAVLEFHVTSNSESINERGDFAGAPMNVWPLEFHAIAALRRHAGLATPYVEHPLLAEDNPLAEVPFAAGACPQIDAAIAEAWQTSVPEGLEERLWAEFPSIPLHPPERPMSATARGVLAALRSPDPEEAQNLPQSITLDWKHSAADGLEKLSEALGRVRFDFEPIEGPELRYRLEIAGRTCFLNLAARDGLTASGIDAIIGAATLLEPEFEVWQFCDTVGSDGIDVLVMDRKFWDGLRSKHPKLFGRRFCRPGTPDAGGD